MTPAAGRLCCRRCDRPLKDELSIARKTGPCCWESLSPAERAGIEAGLSVRPRRLRIRRVPRVPGPREPLEDEQPTLFDVTEEAR